MGSNIKLYTAASPNGFKVSITLTELALPFTVVTVDVRNGEQKSPSFLQINPNGKIPALTDGDLSIWESGAILLYLVEKYDVNSRISFKSSDDPANYWQMVGWTMWHVAEQMPPQGTFTKLQLWSLGSESRLTIGDLNLVMAMHFTYFAPVRSDYGQQKSLEDCNRAYGILDNHLTSRTYLVGEKFTIADIAVYSGTMSADKVELDLARWPNIMKWMDRIEAREGVQAGIKIPQSQYTKEEIADWFRGLKEKLKQGGNADAS